jgi:hypothetical protein
VTGACAPYDTTSKSRGCEQLMSRLGIKGELNRVSSGEEGERWLDSASETLRIRSIPLV